MQNYNLDDNFSEFFEFSLNGTIYEFRYPNIEEITKISNKMKKLSTEQESDVNEFFEEISSFIEPKSSEGKPFNKVYKKMLLPQIKNFMEMLKSELM